MKSSRTIVKLFIVILYMIVVQTEEISNSNDPPEMTINYQSHYRDLKEKQKYAEENISFIKKTKQIENKVLTEIQKLKMMMNIQNIQIEKLNEIFQSNLNLLYRKIGNIASKKALNNNNNLK